MAQAFADSLQPHSLYSINCKTQEEAKLLADQNFSENNVPSFHLTVLVGTVQKRATLTLSKDPLNL